MIEISIYFLCVFTAFTVTWPIMFFHWIYYNSKCKNEIRGLKNQVKMRDDRIEALIEELDSDGVDDIRIGNVRKIGGEWSIATELDYIFSDDYSTIKKLKFTFEKADMSDYTDSY